MGREENLSPELPLSPGDFRLLGAAHAAIRSPRVSGALQESIQRSPTTGPIPGGGGLGGGGGGGGWDTPCSLGLPMVPAEGGSKLFKLKSSWRQRGRSKILAVSLKQGRRGGGGLGGEGEGGQGGLAQGLGI